MNKILKVDSYKLSHFLQYPPGTEHVSSYIEARGVSNDFPLTNEIVNLGIQGFIKEYLSTPITKLDIDDAEEIAKAHGEPFNRFGWERILHVHNGYLPILIQSLPEGLIVPIGTCQVQIVNNDKYLPWLTSYVETALLRAIWYPSTVATLSREIKKLFKSALNKTSDDPDAVIDFMLHDFGARGTSSSESAAIGGAAHLVNFMGSDTLEAVKYIKDVYGFSGMPAYSIPSAEHSTITSWQEFGGEYRAFENMVDRFGGEGKIYAVVSDSYDIEYAVKEIWGKKLKDKVIAKGGRLVVRPDSGDPKTIVLEVVHFLSETFGYTINSKGYMVLHPSVRVIQGDGVNYNSIKEILDELIKYGFAVENVAFGMGGALLQKVHRDSLKYAMKASAIYVNDKWYDVYKDPITDKGKSSKRGVLAVNINLETIRDEHLPTNDFNFLEVVYVHDGFHVPFTKLDTWENIRAKAKIYNA